MKNITTIFIIFLCSIFCFADTWEQSHRQSTKIESWQEITAKGTEKPEERFDHGMVRYNDKYYITCGSIESTEEAVGDIWEMDITHPNKTFTQIYTPDSTHEFKSTYGHATLVLDDKLYVLFGYMYDNNDREQISGIFTYDLTESSQTWVREYDPKIANDDFVARRDFAAAVIDDKIYVFGGSKIPYHLITDPDQIFGSFSYDTDKQNWVFESIELEQNENAPSARDYHSMVAIDNTLYIFGGKGEDDTLLNDLWKYDVSGKIWEKIDTRQEETPEARCDHTMHANGNKEFWILGGYNDDNYLKDLWQFNIAEKKWTRKKDAPVSFARHTSALQEGKNMKIYVWGGDTDNHVSLPADTIYEYKYTVKEDEEDEEEKIKVKGHSSCGLLGIEFIILALLCQRIKMRRK
ncbi:MAG TPA: kelch repeat-containing protein [Planctomycetota bacterium]|jgi:N-acetylneuraminic acid mutarotase|nr:kelch repeat-containing protein [Planctomycetota bacterium]HQB01629.1 kelch repeat-containing protein [Planctomycetota bacterium]